MSLENAPDEVKLAVDLIMLLEENGVAPQTVLGALAIVTRDFERKVRELSLIHISEPTRLHKVSRMPSSA